MDAVQFAALIEKTIREARRAGLPREAIIAELVAAPDKSTALRMTSQEIDLARTQISREAVAACQAVEQYLTDYLADVEPLAENVTLTEREHALADAIVQGLLAEDEFRTKMCRWFELLSRLDALPAGD